MEACGNYNLPVYKCYSITPPEGVVDNAIYSTLYNYAVQYFNQYGYDRVIELFDNVLDQETYTCLYQTVYDFLPCMQEKGSRITVIDTDGIVAIDTSQIGPCLNTYDNYTFIAPYNNFVTGNVGANHNTRVAVMTAQLSSGGVGYENKFSNTLQENQAYVAIRLGNKNGNVGTIRFSFDVPFQGNDTRGPQRIHHCNPIDC